MASFKSMSLVVLSLALVAAVVGFQSNDNIENLNVQKALNNLVLGQREYGDQIIYQENIAEKFLVSGKKLILNRTITAPTNYYITQINCLDKGNDGTGAEPTVTGGGPKLTFVNLRFKSQRWHGIYFKVEVYGKPRYNG